MALVTPSVLVSEIRGKAGSVVFSGWKGRGYVRSLVTPANPNTNDQQGIRGVMRKIVAWWHDLDADVKAAIADIAEATDVSAFNLFVKRNVQDIAPAPGAWTTPPAPPVNPLAQIMPLQTPCNPVDNVVAATGGGAAGTILLTWDQGAAADGDDIFAFVEPHATPFDQSAIAVADGLTAVVQAETDSITGLTPATSYDIYVMVFHAGDLSFSIARPVKATSHA